MDEQGYAPIEDKLSYIAHACTIIALGVFYMLSPKDWYGPSWSYFYSHGAPILPAGGFGLGVCLTGIGSFQLLVLWRNAGRFLAILFFLSAFTFWTAGFILGAEGLAGHHGIQEAPLLIIFGVVKFITMSNVIVDRRENDALR
jgi:hypothetical protein